jgi:hypothetical protein
MQQVYAQRQNRLIPRGFGDFLPQHLGNILKKSQGDIRRHRDRCDFPGFSSRGLDRQVDLGAHKSNFYPAWLSPAACVAEKKPSVATIRERWHLVGRDHRYSFIRDRAEPVCIRAV